MNLRRFLSRLSGALTVALLATLAALASTVRGKVVRRTGDDLVPVSGIGVRLTSKDFRSTETYSGYDGMYYFDKVAPGSYTLEVRVLLGGKPAAFAINVSGDLFNIAPIDLGAIDQKGQRAEMPPLPPLRGTAQLPAAADPAHFTFVVAGDDRPATETATPTATIAKIFAEVAALRPVFMVMLGDTIYGKNDQDQQLVAEEYEQFLQLAAGAGVPVFNAPGNHEMDGKRGYPSATMEAWYKQYTATAPYGAFTFGNSRFIALNTDDLLGSSCAGNRAEVDDAGKKTSKAGKAEKDRYPGDLGTTQLGLLEADLAGDTAITNVFLFMHRPIYAQKSSSRLPKSCRDVLETLFARYPNIRYVLASHEHLFYQPAKLDHPAPPAYLVSGGAGAPLATGGFYNYLVFTVDGSQVTWRMVKPGDTANAAR